MTRSLRDKALQAIAEDRVRVVKATPCGIALDIISASPDPNTLRRVTHRTMLYKQRGELVKACTCPSPRHCYHMTVAEMQWQPGDIETESQR